MYIVYLMPFHIMLEWKKKKNERVTIKKLKEKEEWQEAKLKEIEKGREKGRKEPYRKTEERK